MVWNWKAAIGLLAALQILAGLLGFFLTAPWSEPAPTTPYPLWIYFLIMAAFATAAALLLYGGRSDRRAVYLGITYLLAASAFSYRPLLKLSELLPGSAEDGSCRCRTGENCRGYADARDDGGAKSGRGNIR